ncbi:site-specific DNA-methyltransferase [Patescibacteria group bacterium]|nr:site-specific DNA-methyltransferase [Patescibacteria group bacterium]
MPQQLISIKQASEFASKLLNREVSDLNISYLVQYGKLQKFNSNGSTLIDIDDLKNYYISSKWTKESAWKKILGQDLNWTLAFDKFREKDTTKHVHRLHPYKGKFIPQLVEYFLDTHIDDFKRKAYFHKGDIVLDPFAGSGTTLIQANELGIHSVEIDVSRFNCLIAEVKLLNYNLDLLEKEIRSFIRLMTSYGSDSKIKAFDEELFLAVNDFNSKYFPSPNFKYKIARGEIEKNYIDSKEKEFLKIYNGLIQKYQIKLAQDGKNNFLDKWYIYNTRKGLNYAFEIIKKIENKKIKKILAIILSRTIRSCRATTHSDLATLKTPQLTAYYCYKHMKICRPIFSINKMLIRYSMDTLSRLKEFDKLRTSAFSAIICQDSRTADIGKEIKKINPGFYELFLKKKIKGVFTSPPYVGQIDYHEQHAYAYDLFGFRRKDELEIGPLYKGQGIEARKSYMDGISKVLLNSKKYLAEDYNIFLVANDKYNLYPTIAAMSGMKIVNMYKRPVLNRTERDKSPYSEIIFHFKEG